MGGTTGSWALVGTAAASWGKSRAEVKQSEREEVQLSEVRMEGRSQLEQRMEAPTGGGRRRSLHEASEGQHVKWEGHVRVHTGVKRALSRTNLRLPVLKLLFTERVSSALL